MGERIPSKQQQLFYDEILIPIIDCEYIHQEYPFKESSGKQRYIDFAIITPQSKIAIELDDIGTHGEGRITQDKFSDHMYRQNEILLAGWQLLRFTNQQFHLESQECMDQIKRAIEGDRYIDPSVQSFTNDVYSHKPTVSVDKPKPIIAVNKSSINNSNGFFGILYWCFLPFCFLSLIVSKFFIIPIIVIFFIMYVNKK